LGTRWEGQGGRGTEVGGRIELKGERQRGERGAPGACWDLEGLEGSGESNKYGVHGEIVAKVMSSEYVMVARDKLKSWIA
jgi:hypothetical protein